ncbi:MAG: hypothetical protein QOF43_304 [Gaiellaceae bacterium]|nr:hypothetical protein [Gaiellaceae bacterium]
MFRSRRRGVVYPQAEHQRLAGAIAAEWAEPPALPFESLVRGVATHDRGYGDLDNDGIGELETERWLEIQRRGLAPQGEDAIVELIVAMHSFRLVSKASMPVEDAVVREFEAARDARLAAAGIDPALAAEADAITDLCDRIAFSFCFEEAAAGTVGAIAYAVDPDGTATLDPWPLRLSELRETAVGYEAQGYPGRLVPVERDLVVAPRPARA